MSCQFVSEPCTFTVVADEGHRLPPHPGANFNPLDVVSKLVRELPEAVIKRLRTSPPMWVAVDAHSEELVFATTEHVPGWKVEGRVGVWRDAPVVRELHVTPLDGTDTGLTGEALRQLSLEQLANDARDRMLLKRQTAEIIGLPADPDAGATARALQHARRTQKGRPELPAEYLSRLADAYLAEAGQGHQIYRRIARRLGLDYTDEVMTELRSHVRIARNRGLLPAAPKAGKAGASAPKERK